MSKQAVIVAYGRSAVCRAKKGALARSHPIDWSAQVLCGVLTGSRSWIPVRSPT